MNPLVIVALVILILIVPKHFKLAIAGAALALLAAAPQVNAWSSFQEFATDYTEGVRSSDETDNGKLAVALTYCFTLNGERDDFDKILAKITRKDFVKAMHTPVDYLRSHEIYGGSWIAEGADYPIYPFDVLFLELADNFDSAVLHQLTGNDLKDILDHQEAAKHYIKKYLEALKRTNTRPPPDNENGTENRFYFAMVETNARIQRTGVFDEVPWEGRPNVFNDILRMYETYKST